jgi:hypothetical protein
MHPVHLIPWTQVLQPGKEVQKMQDVFPGIKIKLTWGKVEIVSGFTSGTFGRTGGAWLAVLKHTARGAWHVAYTIIRWGTGGSIEGKSGQACQTNRTVSACTAVGESCALSTWSVASFNIKRTCRKVKVRSSLASDTNAPSNAIPTFSKYTASKTWRIRSWVNE